MIALIPYILMSIVHIVACSLGKQKLRRFTKIFLMPLLCLFCVFMQCKNPYVYMALFFGWIGDIALLKPQEYREKLIGSTIFAIGHICYLIAIIKTLPEKKFEVVWIVPILVGMLVGFIVYKKNEKPIIEPMRISCLGYFLLLGAMAGFSVGLAMTSNANLIGRAVGYVLFLVSDAILVTQWFTVGDPHPKSDTKVMITYCLAQALLVLSFIV